MSLPLSDLRGQVIRDIGYLAWKDDDAALENMRGARWNAAVKEENARWDAAVASGISFRKRILFERELRAENGALEKVQLTPGWCPATRVGTDVCSPALKEHFCAFEYEAGCDDVWVIRDSHSGAERYDLSYWHGSVSTWTKSDVGSSLAVIGGRCYYISARRIHWYAEVRSCDAVTGKDDRREFEVTTNRENAEIIRIGNSVFVRIENSGSSSLHYLSSAGKFVQLVKMGGWQVPFGISEEGRPIYAVRRVESDKYEFVGTSSFPGRGRPIWGRFDAEVYITRRHGGGIDIYHRGIRIRSYPCAHLTVNKALRGDDVELLIQTPKNESIRLRITRNGVREKVWGGEDSLEYMRYEATSEDGTRVPYIAIRTRGRSAAAGLLVYGYGSYGVPTFNGRVMAQWGPLLKRGWAIVYAMIRGSGDSSDSWAQAARLTGRKRGVEDFEAVIRAAQGQLGVAPAQTVIAGRSAGGLLVGAAAVRSPRGELFRGVFAEVPYVDILRTTTNPGLPLTTVEYDEFGWPAGRVEDFATLLELAPIDGLPADGEGAPGIFVVCRSGMNDTQVFAYEPMKWIRRLRGVREVAGRPKVLALKTGQGHFYRTGGEAEAARAEDLGLLDAWVVRENILGFKYKMAARKNMTRKDRKERSRKNMAGGKKSRKATRKGARKASRKASRKAARKD